MHRTLMLCAVIGLSLQAFADTSEPASTDAVYACAALEADTERLACYDAAVGRLKAAEEAGEVTTVTKTEIEKVEREAFGFSMPSLPTLTMPKFGRSASDGDSDRSAEGELQTITAAVTNVSVSKINGLRVTLENGQIWQQTDSRKIYYSKKKGVKDAEVRRAAMGSFMMKLDGGSAFRVKRLK